MSVTLTKHGMDRLRERLGIPKKACQRMAQTAFDNGITYLNVKGETNRYFTRIYLKNTNANNIRIYGKFVYVFDDETLITVLHIPKDIKIFNKSNV